MFVECYNDYEILKLLNYRIQDDFKHSLGKGNVLKDMKTRSRCLGIIDEDDEAGVYPQLKDYPINNTHQSISVRINNSTQNKILIQITGNLEKWIAKMAKDLKINLSDYGILDSFGKMKKRYKRQKLINFRRLVSDLQVHPSFQYFVNTINEFNNS